MWAEYCTLNSWRWCMGEGTVFENPNHNTLTYWYIQPTVLFTVFWMSDTGMWQQMFFFVTSLPFCNFTLFFLVPYPLVGSARHIYTYIDQALYTMKGLWMVPEGHLVIVPRKRLVTLLVWEGHQIHQGLEGLRKKCRMHWICFGIILSNPIHFTYPLPNMNPGIVICESRLSLDHYLLNAKIQCHWFYLTELSSHLLVEAHCWHYNFVFTK